MFDSPEFWVAVAFVAFVGVVIYYRLPAMIAKQLDERAMRIRAELDQARKLREDAQNLFVEYQRKQRDALGVAQEIVTHARSEAERIAKEASEDLEAALVRRRKLAESKIAQAEAQAVKDVREAAVDLALAAAQRIMVAEMQGPASERLLSQAIGDVRRKLQ